MRSLCLASLLALLAGPAFALEGGTPASTDAVSRAAVAIQAVKPLPDGKVRMSECTGVLIAADLVLTAAHCLDEAERPEHVAVFFFQGAQAVPPFAPVAAIIRHPAHVRGWSAKAGDIETRQAEIASDIALIRLRTPASAGHKPLGFDTIASPMALSLAGAGMGGPSARSGTLKRVQLSSVSHTRTGPRLAFATPGKSRVCRGDSGGPVVTASGGIWGIAGAILRASDGCSARMVVVPVDPANPVITEMIRMARGG